MSDNRPQYDLYEPAVAAVREATEAGLGDDELRAVHAHVASRLGRPAPAPEPKRRPLVWLVPASVAACVALAVIFVRTTPEASDAAAPARLVMRSGQVQFTVAGKPRLELLDSTVLEGDALLELEGRSQLRLAFGAEADALLVGPARVRLDKQRTWIESGAVAFHVTPRARGNAPFVVHVGHDQVVVHGTQFVVYAEQGILRDVHVREGTVEVKRGSDAEGRMLTKGDSLSAAVSSALDERWPTLLRAAELDGGYLQVDSTPRGALVRVDGVEVGETPVVLATKLGAHEVALSLDGYLPWSESKAVQPGTERVQVTLEKREDERSEKRDDKVSETRPPRGGTKTTDDLWASASASLRAKRCGVLRRQVSTLVDALRTAEDKAAAALLDAECAVRVGDKQRALQLYGDIARRYADTASAETALFEVATLQHDVGGKRAALTAVDDYLRAYPKGRFADASSFRRCELLVQSSQLPAARECLLRYRQDFGDGQRTPAALMLLATMARIEGRWQEASELYGQYLATTSERAEEALYYRIVCLQKGRLSGSKEAVSEYLRRYPNGPHAKALRTLDGR